MNSLLQESQAQEYTRRWSPGFVNRLQSNCLSPRVQHAELLIQVDKESPEVVIAIVKDFIRIATRQTVQAFIDRHIDDITCYKLLVTISQFKHV